MKKILIPAGKEKIEEGIGFIEEILKSYRYKDKKLEDSLNVCRNELALMVEHAHPDAEVQIKVSRWYSIVNIELSSPGKAFKAEDLQFEISDEPISDQSQEAMKDLIRTSNAGNITRFYRNQYNHTKIELGNQERVFALRTLFALIAAMVFSAIAMFLLPEGAVKGCITYVFEPVQTIFLNVLQLVTAPAVFFSIVTAVAKFASFKDMERIGKKTMAGYIISAILAVILGIVMFWFFQPDAKFTGVLSSMVKAGGKNSSILETVIKSVPNNVVSPFLNVDALQLLILGTLCGIALYKASKESKILNDAAVSLHKFFSTLVDLVSLAIPLAVFFVTTLMILMFGFTAMLVTLHIFIVVVVGFVIMIAISFLSVGIGGRISIVPFFKKMFPYMFQVFWNGSSVNKVQDTMVLCEKNLGISKKVTRFAIPFGAIANLDGNCMYMTVVGLYLTQLCGSQILGKDFVTVAFMVMVLSIGSAITPGSAMLALTMLMGQMGVSLKVICLVLGVNALLELFLAMSNNVREVASALIIARQEELLDKEVYERM